VPQSFFTTETPAVEATDGAPGITTGLTFRSVVDGSVTGMRFYVGASPSGTYTGLLWQRTANDVGSAGTGTELAREAHSGTPAANAWNQIDFDAPVPITAGITYRVGRHHANQYVATNSFGWPLVVDDLVADDDGETGVHLGLIRQGTFLTAEEPGYPQQVGASANYFVDIVFVPAGEGDRFTSGTASLTLAASAAHSTDRATAGVAGLLLDAYGTQPHGGGGPRLVTVGRLAPLTTTIRPGVIETTTRG
jgi:hypothetical protein